MKIKRSKLVQHLKKIHCGGQITEAVFSKAFATNAMTADHLLMVLAPSLKGVEALEDDIGIADLGTVIKSFGFISGEGNEAVDVTIRVEEHRLVIDEERRGKLRLLTANPKTIGTRVEQNTLDKLKAKAPKGNGIQLTRALIEGVQNAFTGFKSTEVELFVGPEGGKIRVGNDNEHVAEFESEELVGDKEYSLLFGTHLIDVLAGVTDFANGKLHLGGPGNFVLIEDGGYKYYVDPRSRGKEDESEPKGKGKSKKKPAPETEPEENDEE